MHDTLPENSIIDTQFDEFLTFPPDGQARFVEDLNRLDWREIDSGDSSYSYIHDLRRKIHASDAPISFLAHDLSASYQGANSQAEPLAVSRDNAVYSRINRIYNSNNTVLLGGVIEATPGFYGGLVISNATCFQAFHKRLPNTPDASIGRFANFWETTGAPRIVYKRFGVDMLSLGLQDQVNIIDFVTNTAWNSPKLQQVESFFNTYGPEKGLASLQALEFGDDYGDSILAIAENATPEQSKEIFDTIASFRESSAAIARWYEAYDPAMARNVELAMNERLADALYAMEALTRDGRLEVDVAPHRDKPGYENDGRFMIRLESVDSGIEILRGLEKSLRLQHEIITAKDVRVSRVIDETNAQFTEYRFSSRQHGDALLYLRPCGAKGHNKDFEYGNRRGVEASISFIVNPSDPHHLRSDKDPQGVSIRFDREGRMHDESPFSDDRDPTREQGSMSLDISSSLGDGRTMPIKIGRLIAAGNILRAAKTGSEVNLHHNMNHFDQARYGSAEGFAKLAIYVAHMAEAMRSMQQHGMHGSKYRGLPGILREAGVDHAA